MRRKGCIAKLTQTNVFVLPRNMSELLVKCVYKVPATNICVLLPPGVETVNCRTAAYFVISIVAIRFNISFSGREYTTLVTGNVLLGRKYVVSPVCSSKFHLSIR